MKTLRNLWETHFNFIVIKWCFDAYLLKDYLHNDFIFHTCMFLNQSVANRLTEFVVTDSRSRRATKRHNCEMLNLVNMANKKEVILILY